MKLCSKNSVSSLTACITVLLAACTSNPPSSAAFMNTYDTKRWSGDVHFKHIAGDVLDSKVEDRNGTTIYEEEDANTGGGAVWFHYGYFSTGLALDFPSLTFIGQTGFVSPYLGVQLWVAPLQWEGDTGKSDIGMGVSLIEQYPVFKDWKIGITEHASQNVYRHSEQECCTFADISAIKYYELGAGAYASFRRRYSIEFQYGNELNSADNRFYLIASALFGQ